MESNYIEELELTLNETQDELDDAISDKRYLLDKFREISDILATEPLLKGIALRIQDVVDDVEQQVFADRVKSFRSICDA